MRGGFKGQFKGSGAVIFVNGGGENARLDVERHGVEVIGSSQPPATFDVEKAMIAEMIVAVRNQDIEHDAPPELLRNLRRVARRIGGEHRRFRDSCAGRYRWHPACSLPRERECGVPLPDQSGEEEERRAPATFSVRHVGVAIPALLGKRERCRLPKRDGEKVAMLRNLAIASWPSRSMMDAFGRRRPGMIRARAEV